ncbi:hypothetical protein F383_32449 [Gossypium arboreum]|uniref:Uncharacterized protein n=1 Tax=Gossypium arboreum TaxID=29729 RepID=A0A0B0PJQ0_GOSAR|nr:hypothetical protein F383_32449 [Gossypium arboreum]
MILDNSQAPDSYDIYKTMQTHTKEAFKSVVSHVQINLTI